MEGTSGAKGGPTVGLALIARDEQASLPALLASVQGAFDQVALLDTGSKDDTVEVFGEWAGGQDLALGHRVERFEWVDDFSAARNAADALLDTDWKVWADCDDVLHGAHNLRAIAAQAEPDVCGFVASYDYAYDPHGNVICVLKRERMVRAGASRWEGRVHEAQIVAGRLVEVGPDVVRWAHQKQRYEPKPDAPRRNLRILRKWAKDEPDNPRVLAYLGTELAATGKHRQALAHYRKYLKLPTGWPEERAQVHRKLAVSLLALEEPAKAYAEGKAALDVVAPWPDNFLTLAQASYALGRHEAAIFWAERVLELGQPDSLLILNPLDYTLQPLVCLAASYGALGDVDAAIEHATKALSISPDHAELRTHLAGWRSTSQREHVAATFCGSAEMLVRHDEQLKALELLESCVPAFATDHPRVVALRSQLRERLAWLRDPAAYAGHYDVGGPEPEDFVSDENVEAFGGQLSRTAFLREGVAEQLGRAA